MDLRIWGGGSQRCRRWDRNKATRSIPPWLSLQMHVSGRSLLDLGLSALGQKGEGQGFRAQQRGWEEKDR